MNVVVISSDAPHQTSPWGCSPRRVRCRRFWPQALERALSLDWIGAIKDQGRVGQGLLAKSSIAVEHCGGRLAMIGDCQRGRPAAI
jgi:hypothetical protein